MGAHGSATAEARAEAWAEFVGTRSPESRDRLIAYYYPLVRKVAGTVWRTVQTVEVDDLASYGTPGLIRAVDNYDPTSAASFETYAIASIRGTILDELRSQDWAPRSLRKRQRRVEKAVQLLEGRLGREPSVRELAKHIEESEDFVASTRREAEAAKHRSLDEKDGPEAPSRYEAVRDDRAEDPEATQERGAVLEVLSRQLETLTPVEQLILALHYYENRTLAEAGREAGIPESRASQIHTRAMMAVQETLREELAG